MKPLSICRRNVLWICLILFCGAAAVVAVLCSSNKPRKTEGSFFEIAGFAPEDVSAVTICFEDTSAELLDADRQRLLTSLTNTQGTWVTFDHAYPYHVSEYSIQLHVGDDVYEFPFAWFSGYEYVISGSGDLARYTSLIQYTDRRVDVQIDGFWFSFQQTGDTFWNEDISYMAYSACIPQENGNRVEACYGGSSYVNKTPDYTDPKFYIYNSDLIVVAKHVKRDYIPVDPSAPQDAYYHLVSQDSFEVTEILKGEWDISQPISIKQLAPEINSDGTLWDLFGLTIMQGGIDSRYSYIDEDGGTYLLFLNYTDSHYSAEPVYLPYTRESLARIYNDTAYACVNHENHAFFARPMDEIRAMCKD